MKKYLRKSFAVLLAAFMLLPVFVIQAGAAITFERKLGVPVDYQFNYTTVRWGSDRSTKSSGCGAASASMVVEYFTNNTSQNPDTLFTWCCKNGYYYGNGLDFSTVGVLCKNYGVTMTYASGQTQVINALKAGNPVIALMGPGTFTSGGHYIVLSGIKIENGTTYIRVNDPNSSSRTNSYYTISLIASQLKNWAICTYSTAAKGPVGDFYVEPGKYSQVNCSDGLNLRSSNSSSSTLLVTIPNGTYLKVNSITGSWASTTYNGMSGYVYTPYLRDGGEPSVSAPKITAPSAMAYGSSATVSWTADAEATSYSYKAVAYPGEMSVGGEKTIASGSGTATSFTVPAQTGGKYVKVTVTATGTTNSESSSSVIMLGGAAAYPTEVQYIPVVDINGTVNESNSTIWTASKGSAFTAVYWDAFLCSPNSDGTYKVKEAHRSGNTKSVTASGTDIVFAIHVSYTNYAYANNIAVGDTLTLNGVYIDKNIVNSKAHILVNGGIPLAPNDITPGDGSIKKVEGKDAFRGFTENTNVANARKKFAEDSEYLIIRKANGETAGDSDILCTGYTVNIVVNGNVSVSYDLVVAGDINGDGTISTSDYAAARGILKNTYLVSGSFECASDIDSDGTVSSNDYILLKAHLAGTSKISG
ncbi:MAG: C39 family peptidase [Clostridia bacterium]|nr:C39 family peptidase [Clostridia bacterium]